MEWRQQTTVSCAEAFNEAQRWIEEVTGKSFGSNNFRAALENGVLLCDLINQLKPGIIKRLNRLSTPIAGLDNVNVFLKACGKLGLNESQLFHSGDLQDLSTRVTLRQDEGNRRLKNVLITIYWLGRKAHQDAFYSGPQLNFKAFEGLLGLALSKSLDEGGNVFVKDNCYPEREEWQRMGPIYKRQSSVDSVDSLDSRHLYPNNEGCGSDAEAEQEFRMEATQPSTQQHKGYIPPPLLRRKQRQEVNGRGCASPLARPYQNQVRPERPVQVNPGWIWSKSLSDIPMVYPVRKGPSESTIYDVDQNTNMAGEWDSENKRANSVGPKDGEAHWHDELTKWKNRRRSTKSDLRTMSQDREHVINQMTNGAVTDFKNEMQSRQLKRCGEKSSPCTPKTSVFRDQQASCRHNPAPRPYSTSPPSKPLSAHLRPRTRALLARSYATEAPFSPTVSLNSARSQEPPVTPDGNVLGEETHIVSLASDGGGVTTPSQDCPFSSQTQVKSQPKETIKLASCISRSQEEGQKTSWEPAVEQGRGQQAAGPYKNWSSSASLPRGFRRSEGSSRLSTAITARPFGTKPSRVSSLKRYNVDHSDMRVSLSLKPNSRQDFGFHTYWDSTGTRVKFIEAGSPAELCQLCVDDEIVAVDGVSVANMNENQWKDKLTHALQNGSLTMDIRRYGNKDWSNSEWSHHNQPGQSRMTLNLTPAASVLIGCPDHHANSAASADTTETKVSKFNGQTENVVQGRVMDGEHGDSCKTSRSKDYNEMIRENQKRRAEFFKLKGGSESAISDLQVPSLNPSSSSWSWDCEEDRRRQEKWQEEQERLLQEKYKQDQERMEAEWQKAQQDAMGDLYKKAGNTTDGISGGESPASTQPHVNGVTNKTREAEWSPDRDQLKEAGSKSQSNAQGVQNDIMTGSDWTKSLSTPVLSAPHKQPGDQRKRKGQSVSQAEQDRKQILEEMKKRNHLLTDNSWIRQRNAGFYKEPADTGFPLKKHESLDNLDILNQSPVFTTTLNYPRPHSAAAGYSVPSRNSSSRYSTGAILSQRNASGDYSHHGSVWAATDTSEELRLESRFDSETGSPTVSPAISNSSPLVSPPCDQHAILHIAE
ncbi:LIM domain only protein 7-like isoform X2 [Anabas testudineus]|uniref:LIM domain only protein 7-like isoform X2 n=1 Tax=Anabas testudineus TaxID=64144 RepID=UPI000E45F0F2|nr:LIM domain only protein 7-like isoform X2 [Anabas testudineus]